MIKKYEQETYEIILNRMLDRVSNQVDKRQGSVIYDTLAPIAAELAQFYISADTNLNMAFADTAVGVWLEKRTAELGVFRREASSAYRKGTFKTSNDGMLDVPLGSRFTIENLVYTAEEKLSPGIYKMKCGTPGSIGNNPIGAMLPLNNIQGLESSELSDCLIYGEDEETDEELYKRYRDFVTNPPMDGNVAQYLNWAENYQGIGRAKVYPLWQGDNTVKVSIIDSKSQPASDILIGEFQQYLDPDSAGLGEGQAPIGAKVTVTTASKKLIDIVAEITLNPGATLETTEAEIRELVTDYFDSKVAYLTKNVSYIEIGSLLLKALGTNSVVTYTLNGGNADIALGEEEVPVLEDDALTLKQVTS